jgi:hypothetical protein
MKLADAAARYVRRFVYQLQLCICGVRGSENVLEALNCTPDVNKVRVRGVSTHYGKQSPCKAPKSSKIDIS